MAEVRLVNRYIIIYIFYDDIIMLIITTMRVHILYNTVWVIILFVVAASLL